MSVLCAPREVFYRAFENHRQIASYPGLTPTPFQSGGMDRDRRISRACKDEARGGQQGTPAGPHLGQAGLAPADQARPAVHLGEAGQRLREARSVGMASGGLPVWRHRPADPPRRGLARSAASRRARQHRAPSTSAPFARAEFDGPFGGLRTSGNIRAAIASVTAFGTPTRRSSARVAMPGTS
jgi:Transposase IS116/IS110/IS902 family